MKKKALTIALVVALMAIMVGGSLAWFTDQDKVTNTFTIGSVKIEIYENNSATTSDTMSFGKLTPIVNTETPSTDKSYIKKAVTVKNTGLNDAYIRTHIAIPTKLVGYLYLDLNEEGWTRQTDSTATDENGVDYTVFTYDYDTAVPAGKFTSELLQGVYLGSNVDLEEDADGNLFFVIRGDGAFSTASGVLAHKKNDDGSYTSETINVLVASEAIQAQGFNDATTALNSGFGENTNPWQ